MPTIEASSARACLRGALIGSLLAIAAFGGATAGAADAGNKRGTGSIVMNVATGQVLHQSNPDQLLYPASLTKVMTLYLTFEALENGRLKLKQQLPVSKIAASRAPTKLGLPAGATLAVEDAILALVTKSANDVATVLAEALGGDEDSFAQTMTARARQLGMTRTVFRNASGLPDMRQVSTPRDMARLGLAIQRDFPQHFHYFGTEEASVAGQSLRNHNRLLGSYDGVDGIKTGYTVASGFNLISSAQREDVRLIGVVFGGRTARSRDDHMRGLLDDAFSRSKDAVLMADARPPARAGRRAVVPEDKREIVAGRDIVATADVVEAQPVRNGRREPAAPRIAAAPAAVRTAPAAAAQPAARTTARTAPEPQSLQQGDVGGDAWGIQVGAFRNYHSARERASAAAELLKGPSDRIAVSITPGGRSGASPIYRVRLIGLADEREARRACIEMKRHNIGCLPLAPNAA